MSNTRRIPFTLNLDDPVDAAIWQALEPMLDRRRASMFIRGAVAHALGVGGLLPPVMTPTSPMPSVVPSLSSGEPIRAKRPLQRPIIEETPVIVEDNPDALEDATTNFLSMFG